MPNKTKGIIKDRDFYRRIGSIGGNETKKRLAEDPTYYERIGRAGAETMMKKAGKDFYAAIGKLKPGEKLTLKEFLEKK